MSRVALAMPVNARMYRHFAAITLAVTGLVALFADGESRESIRNEVEARETRRALREEQAEKHNFRRDIAAMPARPEAGVSNWDSGAPAIDGDTSGSYIPDDMEVAELSGDMPSDTLPAGELSAPPVPPPGIPGSTYAPSPSAPGLTSPRRPPQRRLTPVEQERLRRAIGDSEPGAFD